MRSSSLSQHTLSHSKRAQTHPKRSIWQQIWAKRWCYHIPANAKLWFFYGSRVVQGFNELHHVINCQRRMQKNQRH